MNYPSEIGPFAVTAVRDLTVGFDSEQPDNKPVIPLTKSSQMITFKVNFKPNPSVQAVFTLRTSGTEPKIKYYTEISGPLDRKVDIDEILKELVNAIVSQLIKPEKFGL